MPLYLVWEISQMPGFAGLPASWLGSLAWCLVATVGDGALVVVTFLATTLLFREWRWFLPLQGSRIVVATVIGVILHSAAEWVMVHWLHLWAYTAWQPVIPVFGIGLFVVLQAAVLLPVTFVLLAKWESSVR